MDAAAHAAADADTEAGRFDDAALREGGPGDAAVRADARMDAQLPGLGGDAMVLDAAGDASRAAARASAMCSYAPECAPKPYPDWIHCEEPTPLEPGTPLTMQDTAAGGYGECAASGSGGGGPRLYYSVAIPPESTARVIVTPLRQSPSSTEFENALLRVLSDCYAHEVVASDRGGAVSLGKSGVCLRNEAASERRALVAVSQYSGEQGCLPLLFDITVRFQATDEPCPLGAFDVP